MTSVWKWKVRHSICYFSQVQCQRSFYNKQEQPIEAQSNFNVLSSFFTSFSTIFIIKIYNSIMQISFPILQIIILNITIFSLKFYIDRVSVYRIKLVTPIITIILSLGQWWLLSLALELGDPLIPGRYHRYSVEYRPFDYRIQLIHLMYESQLKSIMLLFPTTYLFYVGRGRRTVGTKTSVFIRLNI